MSTLGRALLCLLIVAGADALAFAPAVFDARLRTPRRIAEALVIADGLAVALITAVVLA